MHLRVRFESPLHRSDQADYMTYLSIDVLAQERISDTPYIVGKIEMEKLHWFDAQEDGYSLLHVCDADSAGWLEVYEILTEVGKDGRLRADLQLEDFFVHVFLMHHFLLHPDIEDRVAVLDAAIRATTTNDSVVATWHEAPHNTLLTDAELAELGFKKIAGSSLIFRDNHFRYKFGDAHPRGRELQFEGNAQRESWLLNHWNGGQAERTVGL